MATSGGDFRFVNAPAARRTARIPAQKWEEHKALIIQLYLESNLSEVVFQMGRKHDFHAT